MDIYKHYDFDEIAYHLCGDEIPIGDENGIHQAFIVLTKMCAKLEGRVDNLEKQLEDRLAEIELAEIRLKVQQNK